MGWIWGKEEASWDNEKGKNIFRRLSVCLCHFLPVLGHIRGGRPYFFHLKTYTPTILLSPTLSFLSSFFLPSFFLFFLPPLPLFFNWNNDDTSVTTENIFQRVSVYYDFSSFARETFFSRKIGLFCTEKQVHQMRRGCKKNCCHCYFCWKFKAEHIKYLKSSTWNQFVDKCFIGE